MPTARPPDYSPSLAHAPLLRRRPALAWDGQPVGAWQRKLRRALREALGLAPVPAEAPRARLLWKREWSLPHTGRLGTIHKVELLLAPFARGPAYLCLPDGPRPRAIIICLQGHSSGMHNSIGLGDDEATPIEVAGDRDFAVQCVKRGYGALALEQRSLGERRERRQERKSFHNDCHDAAMRALLVGSTLLGERVFDVQRAAHWLRASQGANVVGVLGNSGGGTVATMAAAMDTSIDFAVASCSFCTIARSIASIHHCTDNYVPRMSTIADTGDVGGLVAPRPFIVVAGKEDPIFPIAGVRAAFSQARRIHEASRSRRARLVVGGEGHRFYADLAFDALDAALRQRDA